MAYLPKKKGEAIMSEQARKARNEYNRKYFAEHPEKRKEYNRRYWERRAQKAAENGSETA